MLIRSKWQTIYWFLRSPVIAGPLILALLVFSTTRWMDRSEAPSQSTRAEATAPDGATSETTVGDAQPTTTEADPPDAFTVVIACLTDATVGLTLTAPSGGTVALETSGSAQIEASGDTSLSRVVRVDAGDLIVHFRSSSGVPQMEWDTPDGDCTLDAPG